MSSFFNIKRRGSKVQITKRIKAPLVNVTLYTNTYFLGYFSSIDQLMIQLPVQPSPHLFIQGYMYERGGYYHFSEVHPIVNQHMEDRKKNNVDYQPGDILVACDNANAFPYGYMGHAGIVVDDKHLIHSVMSPPIIRKTPIKKFIYNHPNHAHYRPKLKKMGEQAAQYAINYLETFKENKEKGINKPVFYFTMSTPLKNEWTYIYCSKLVWLSYYYGANYEFSDDGLWFAPEDLYSILKDNPDFEEVYIHPDYTFYIDI